MRKLIQFEQENMIECDTCDYVVPNNPIPQYDVSHYINKPCPKCGDNLLTWQDYQTNRKLMKAINWLNKWFSWVTIFYSPKKEKTFVAKAHNGLHIKPNDKD